MFSDVHRETMRASWAAILEAIKVSEGMPVSDLARELKMSYMGVKQHCLKLTELGFLEEWRVPREKKEVGRPEKLYRLTPKCDGLFPEAGVGLTLAVLEGVRQIYGDSAPEKLLFYHFQLLRDQWQPKVRAGKSMVEKAMRLADVRDKSGWFSKCHYDSSTGFRIEEFHSPMTSVLLGNCFWREGLEAAFGPERRGAKGGCLRDLEVLESFQRNVFGPHCSGFDLLD